MNKIYREQGSDLFPLFIQQKNCLEICNTYLFDFLVDITNRKNAAKLFK